MEEEEAEMERESGETVAGERAFVITCLVVVVVVVVAVGWRRETIRSMREAWWWWWWWWWIHLSGDSSISRKSLFMGTRASRRTAAQKRRSELSTCRMHGVHSSRYCN